MKNKSGVPRGRGRPRSFDIEAAVERAVGVFWRRGYEGTSVDDLTTAMGITTQSFYSAFHSKAELFRLSLTYYKERMASEANHILEEEPRVSLAVSKAIKAMASEFTRSDRPRGCMRCTAMVNCRSEHEEIAAFAAGFRDQTVALMKRRLDRAVKEGELKSIDTRSVALFFNALFVGMAVAAQDGGTRKELEGIGALGSAALAPYLTE